MIKLYRKHGWVLNPNDTVINVLLESIENNNGGCISSHEDNESTRCPCAAYRLHNKCYCGLYLQVSK